MKELTAAYPRLLGGIIACFLATMVVTNGDAQTGQCPISLAVQADPTTGDGASRLRFEDTSSIVIPALIPLDPSVANNSGQGNAELVFQGFCENPFARSCSQSYFALDCSYSWSMAEQGWAYQSCSLTNPNSNFVGTPPYSPGATIGSSQTPVSEVLLMMRAGSSPATSVAASLNLSAIYTSLQCKSYTCDPQRGPIASPLSAGTICHDQNANICTGTKTCDGTGICQTGSVSLPSSTDPCTAFTCNPTLGFLVSVPKGAPAYCSIPPATFQIPPSFAGQPTNNWVTAQNLLTGTSPRQTLPQTCRSNPSLCIDPVRTGILRGRVLQYFKGDPSNKPLAGVTVSILNHAEFGSTLTQEDGYFDLAVNTGGSYVVDFQSSSFLDVQRTVRTRWQDIAMLDDIVMIPPDPATPKITFSSSTSTWQHVDGQPRSDPDGTRTGHLLIPPHTTATGPNGPVTTASVSATEFTAAGPSGTVGTALNGVHAMPGTLPPTSAYTYAMELGATDDSNGQSLDHLTFNQNVFYYVDNFVSGGTIPSGAAVPTGFYDRGSGAWIANYSPSQTLQGGEVINITQFMNGQAVLSQQPTQTPLDPGELQELYNIYQNSSLPISLWRIPLSHFSIGGVPVDANFAQFLPSDAIPPNGPPPIVGAIDNACMATNASTIECENQILHESVPIVGTPFSLNYSSDRMPGYQTVINVALDGTTVPPDVYQVVVIVQVAGTQIVGFYKPPMKPNQWVQLYWNRKNAYGQLVEGQANAHVNVGYIFNLTGYTYNTNLVLGIGQYLSTNPSTSGGGGGGGGGRQQAFLWQQFDVPIGDYDATALGLGGWTLSPYHAYQPTSGELYLGDGTRRSDLNAIISAVTTNPTGLDLNGMAGSADGSYFYSTGQGMVYQVSPAARSFGSPTLFAGGGTNAWTDNMAAKNASFGPSSSLAVGPDGSVYVGEYLTDGQPACGIRKVDISGNITTVVGYTNAGTKRPVCGYAGDNHPATSPNAQLNLTAGSGFRVLADGTIIIADTMNNRVRRVRTDGVIETIAGTGQSWNLGKQEEGIPATTANISSPIDVDVGPDGTIYIAEQAACRIRSLTVDGNIHTYAGMTTSSGVVSCNQNGAPDQNGVAATQTTFSTSISSIAIAPDGTVYILDSGEGQIRSVDNSGIIHHVVGGDRGTGASSCQGQPNYGDGGPAGAGNICGETFDIGLAALPNGAILVADNSSGNVRQIGPAFPRFTTTSDDPPIVIPSASGDEVYEFDPYGNHKQTLDGLRGVLKYAFTRNPSTNQITRIVDYSGSSPQSTTITQSGNQIQIKPQFAGPTTLTLDTNGYLSAITNPNNETISLVHDGTGLLQSLTDAKGQTHTYSFDSQGLLTLDKQPPNSDGTTSGSLALSHALIGNGSGTAYGSSVTTVSASGYTQQYDAQTVQSTSILPGGGTERQYTSPTGAITDSQSGVAGTAGETTTTTMPDGSIAVVTLGPDARFGMLAPIVTASSFTTPNGGPSTGQTTNMTAGGTYPDLTSLITSTTVNGTDIFTSTYQQGSPSTITMASPTGRTITLDLDTNDRVVQVAIPGIAPKLIAYDSYGRIHTVTQNGNGSDGTRQQTINYGPTGFVSTVVDALNGTTKYARDPVGRVQTLTMRDGVTSVLFDYDLNGNLSALTTPGKNVHSFPAYTPVDLLETYDPPEVGSVKWDTTYSYTPEGQLKNIVQPDPGANLGFAYDNAGRIVQVSQPTGSTLIGYNDLTTRPATIQSPDGVSLSLGYYGPLLKSTIWHWDTGGLSATHTVNRSYDAYLRANHFDVDGTNAVDLRRDADGFVYSAKSSGVSPPVAMTVARDPNGPKNGLLASTVIGGVSDSWTYDGFGEPISYNAVYKTGTSATSLYTVTYIRDGFGRITSKTEIVASFSGGQTTSTTYYVYDALGRLCKAGPVSETTCSTPSADTVFSYDANGNRTTVSGLSVGTYDSQDRLVQYNSAQYSYINNGELKSVLPVGAQPTSYVYDLLGNLKTVNLPAGTITYLADGENRRVVKLRNGVFTKGFLYEDSLRPLAELSPTGVVLRTFVYGTGRNVPDFMVEPSNNVYRIITDQLGSPRLVVNVANGVIAERIDYDAFGDAKDRLNPNVMGYTSVPFGFTGGLYDADTGLVRLGARDYDATAGRWTAKDPIRFSSQDTNLYTATLGDPINFVDPSGLMPSIWGRIGRPWYVRVIVETFAAYVRLRGVMEDPQHNDEIIDEKYELDRPEIPPGREPPPREPPPPNSFPPQCRELTEAEEAELRKTLDEMSERAIYEAQVSTILDALLLGAGIDPYPYGRPGRLW
jgi:RHS repeat-associated protein